MIGTKVYDVNAVKNLYTGTVVITHCDTFDTFDLTIILKNEQIDHVHIYIVYALIKTIELCCMWTLVERGYMVPVNASIGSAATTAEIIFICFIKAIKIWKLVKFIYCGLT